MSYIYPVHHARQNRTRYDLFWRTVNWRLPDSVLAFIWNVDRGNLRARRVRLHELPPRWCVREDSNSPVYKAAVQLENLKANKFTGAKPANTAASIESNPKIAAELSLEIVKPRDDGRASLNLRFRLLGVASNLTTEFDADEDLTHPRVVASFDSLGLSADDQKVFALAAYNHMVRYFGAGPTGGTIAWARWLEVDLSPWLGQSLDKPAADRIRQTFSSEKSPNPHGISHAFTESLEV